MNTENKNNTIQIGDRLIGNDQPTYIIAEIGINHNGNVSTAKELINAAADANVDAVKFQKRDLPSLYRDDVLNDTLKYEQNFQYMIPILQEMELSEKDMLLLKRYSEDRGLEFLCTPFDIPSAEILMDLEVNAFKIASADLTNLGLIEYLASNQKPLIISTGMSFWEEIEKTVELLNRYKTPFALLHCRSVYPVWPREVNLRMINRLGQFKCPVGYSGHDIGITIPLIAASMGASIIEKHITLDKKMRGPDHKISLEPYELKRLVRDIRVADQAMGKNKRFLLRGEVLNRELFGKSLIATQDIRHGTEIEREMIEIKGPGKGLSPANIDGLVGKKIQRDISKNDFFVEEDIEGIMDKTFSHSFRSRWGLIARFNDADKILAYNPKVIEFHLAEKDFQIDFSPGESKPQELVVHVPEYIGDRLFDLCSGSEEVRSESVRLAQKTIDLTRKIAGCFKGIPKVIIHPGAMSLNTKLDKNRLHDTLLRSLEEIDGDGTDILPENLPPYPWYFGGQWKGNYFMDADEIKSFCEETRMNICFDLSHAALYCNAKETDIKEYIRTVKPFISHIHFADGYGLDGEGVQFGEGDIDLDEVMPLFDGFKGTWVPEIWRGHLNNGRGFIKALRTLGKYNL